MQNTQTDPILSPMQRTVNRNLLKYAASRAIFCPGCNQIMDWRKTMILDVTKDSAPIKTMVFCTTCGDKALPSLQKACLDRNLVLEITDGRRFK